MYIAWEKDVLDRGLTRTDVSILCSLLSFLFTLVLPSKIRGFDRI